MSAEIFNNILRNYGESVSRISRGEPMRDFVRDPIEFVEPVVEVYHPCCDLVGRGDTEEEAHADLQAQIDELRLEHRLTRVRRWRWKLEFPFKECDCPVCDPARYLTPAT
jgi:hypothetical protein